MIGRTISFIVPAYNEERLLARTLAAIHRAAQDVGDPYELIVVDDASTDSTAEIARKHDARVLQVQYRQIARTRNAGGCVASGDLLIFVDADTVVSARTIRATIAAIRDGAVGGGADLEFDGRVPVWARMLLVLLRLVFHAGKLAAGCYVFSTRAAFEATGGFDETLFAAEEIAFSRALAKRGRVVILREAVTTSGRKVRAHSGWELVPLITGFARKGTELVRSRERLALWYGERREDPEAS